MHEAGERDESGQRRTSLSGTSRGRLGASFSVHAADVSVCWPRAAGPCQAGEGEPGNGPTLAVAGASLRFRALFLKGP